MERQLKNKGIDRQSFIPWNIEVDEYHENIKKIDLSFDAEYIILECPNCKSRMNLTPTEIRGIVMDIGVTCSKCPKQKFLIKLKFDKEFEPEKV